MATTTTGPSSRVSEFIQALASLISVFIFLTGINSIPEWLTSQYSPPYYVVPEPSTTVFSLYWYALPYYLSLPVFIVCMLLVFGAFFIFTFTGCKWLHSLGLTSTFRNYRRRDSWGHWTHGIKAVDSSPTNEIVTIFFAVLGVAVTVLALVPFVRFPTPAEFQSSTSMNDSASAFGFFGLFFGLPMCLLVMAGTADAIVKAVGKIPGTITEVVD